MGYVFNCDGCETRKDHRPPFMGEFNEVFLRTKGGAFAEDYNPGQTVTLCAECCRDLLL